MSQYILEEIVQQLPRELVQRSKGLAMDLGSSVYKFVYMSKEDADELSSTDTKYGHMRLVSFPMTALNAALDYVRERAVGPRRVDGQQLAPTIYTTGFGCSMNGKLICDKFDIKLEQLTEFDCFAKSFFYLASRLPRTELLHTFVDEATVEPIQFVMSQMRLAQKMTDGNVSKSCQSAVDDPTAAATLGFESLMGRPSPEALTAGDVPLTEAESDVFPCLLMMVGSAYFSFRIEKDGTFKIADVSPHSGKSFCAIGSLLTGSNTYGELLELAAHGSQRGVDQFTDDIVNVDFDAADGDTSLYTWRDDVVSTPGLVFAFGKAVGSNLADLKREDLARAWLNYFVLDLVRSSQLLAVEHGVKRVFFSGSFCDNPLVRADMTAEWVRRGLRVALMNKTAPVQFDFVKPGAFLGALGCLLHDIEQSSGN